jgi:hypothetical protein
MGIHTTRVRRSALSLLIVASLGITATACGSDSKKSTSTTTPATSPEEHIADDAAVTAGLGRMLATATKIAGSVAAGTKVTDAQDQLEADWSQVEGTFRQNEPDMYLSVEESLTGIGPAASGGNAADTAKFAAALATTVQSYLAKHP